MLTPQSRRGGAARAFVVRILVKEVFPNMPRRGECIYKRKDGRWEARYVKGVGPDGRKRYGSVYADSYRKVKAKQRNCLLAQPPPPRGTPAITVADLMDDWLGSVRGRVKLSTYRKYEGVVQRHILPRLGWVPLALVTRAMLEEFAAERLAHGRTDGGPLSPRTVNDLLIVLGQAFEFAGGAYGLILPRVELLREEKHEAAVLTREQQAHLTGYLLQDMDLFRFGVLLALYTGLRVGELCALTWADVTPTALRVNKTMQRLRGDDGHTRVMVSEPKSASSRREVPLPAFLLPYVEQFRRPEGYVLYTRSSPWAEPRVVQQRFARMAADCGLEGVTFHTLRHSFATRCVEAGFDAKTLSEILGHADVKTTLNRYVHSSFEQKQSCMARLTLF